MSFLKSISAEKKAERVALRAKRKSDRALTSATIETVYYLVHAKNGEFTGLGPSANIQAAEHAASLIRSDLKSRGIGEDLTSLRVFAQGFVGFNMKYEWTADIIGSYFDQISGSLPVSVMHSLHRNVENSGEIDGPLVNMNRGWAESGRKAVVVVTILPTLQTITGRSGREIPEGSVHPIMVTSRGRGFTASYKVLPMLR